VEEVTITLLLKKLGTDSTMYVEYGGGYDSLLYPISNPLSTWWHETWPKYCQWWHVNSWHDNGNLFLNSCDTIDIAKAEDVEWWHVQAQPFVAGLCSLILDQGAFRKYLVASGPPNPDSCAWKITHPICTWWREVVPPADTIWWHIGSWIDSGLPHNELSVCDTIDIVRAENLEWWHVEDVAIDIQVLSGPVPRTPTMTQWGVVVLAALIVISAVYIMLRRRRATVPA
jgi:hypothetical protein